MVIVAKPPAPTVTGTLAVTAPKDAVTFVVPAATPVTKPLEFTVAIVGFALDHENAAASGSPEAFFAIAVSGTTDPIVVATVVGATVIEATSVDPMTTMVPVLETSPTKASIAAVPLDSACTFPVTSSTEAMSGCLLVNRISAASVLCEASLAPANIKTESPTSSVSSNGVRSILVTRASIFLVMCSLHATSATATRARPIEAGLPRGMEGWGKKRGGGFKDTLSGVQEWLDIEPNVALSAHRHKR